LNLESVRNELIKVGQVLLVKFEDMLSRGLGNGLAATVEEAVTVAVVEGPESVEELESVEGASVIDSTGEVSVGEGTTVLVASVVAAIVSV
jgi:hypothetical protein